MESEERHIEVVKLNASIQTNKGEPTSEDVAKGLELEATKAFEAINRLYDIILDMH